MHTPRIADESMAIDMRKKESGRKKQRSGKKTMGCMNRKTQEQKSKDSIKKRRLQLEREKRLRALREEERMRDRKKEMRKLWMPEMPSVAHEKIEDTPVVHRNTFAPNLKQPDDDEAHLEADAIDMAVTFQPKVEKIEPQKAMDIDDSAKLEEEDEDIFEELERQQKEDEWATFKEKLNLTNWVEDIVLERFQN